MELHEPALDFSIKDLETVDDILVLPRGSLQYIQGAFVLNRAARELYDTGNEDRATSMLHEAREMLLSGLLNLFALRGTRNLIVLHNRNDIKNFVDEVNDVMTDFMPF